MVACDQNAYHTRIFLIFWVWGEEIQPASAVMMMTPAMAAAV